MVVYVETTPSIPSVFAFAVESFAGCSLTGRTATRRSGEPVRRSGEDRVGGGQRVQLDAGSRRDDADVRSARGEGGVARRGHDALAEAGEPGVRGGAADPQRRRSAGGEREQLREPLRLHEPPLLVQLEGDRSGEDDACLLCRRRERGRPHAGCLDAERQRDRACRPRQRRERRDDRVGGGGAVEDVSGPRGNDGDARSVQRQRGAAARPVDGLGHLVQLVGQRAVEDPRRRRHVRSEEVDVDAAEAAERPEAVALALRRVDGRLPVGLDAEGGGADPEPLARRDEDDRLVGERGRPALEQRPRVLRLQPADVDPVDADAFGDLRRRSGEDEAEHDAGADDHADQEEHPPGQRRPRLTRGPATTAAGRAGRLRLPAHLVDGSPRSPHRQ